MFKYIYLSCILILILWTIYIIYDKQNKYNIEIKRINFIEKQLNKNKLNKELTRSNSIPCDIDNLFSPRDCYIESGYTCKWSMESDRCNKILK